MPRRKVEVQRVRRASRRGHLVSVVNPLKKTDLVHGTAAGEKDADDCSQYDEGDGTASRRRVGRDGASVSFTTGLRDVSAPVEKGMQLDASQHQGLAAMERTFPPVDELQRRRQHGSE
jgi:hypothetical protein